MEKEEILKNLEGYVELKDDSTFNINWKKIENLSMFDNGARSQIYHSLRDLGVMTNTKKGSYGIIGRLGELNLTVQKEEDAIENERYYFSKKNYAEEYKIKNLTYSSLARLLYDNTEIIRYEE
jgi:hypothetical protein